MDHFTAEPVAPGDAALSYWETDAALPPTRDDVAADEARRLSVSAAHGGGENEQANTPGGPGQGRSSDAAGPPPIARSSDATPPTGGAAALSQHATRDGAAPRQLTLQDQPALADTGVWPTIPAPTLGAELAREVEALKAVEVVVAALESLARRFRSGELAAPRFEANPSEAAAVAAALAVLLREPR